MHNKNDISMTDQDAMVDSAGEEARGQQHRIPVVLHNFDWAKRVFVSRKQISISSVIIFVPLEAH